MHRQKGFSPIILILIFAVLFTAIFLYKFKPAPSFKPTPTPVSTPIPKTPTPTPAPVKTPTSSTPTPTPKVVVTTPKPTPATLGVNPGEGFYYGTVATEKGSFQASVLSINLNSSRMITDTGNDGDCSTNCTVLPLINYVNRNGGFAGINGTYFCPATYPECAGKTNSYDFPVWNSRLGKWINGGNLFWNGRAVFYFDGSGAHYLQNANSFSGGVLAGIVNFPGLLDNGNVQIDDNQSGLSDKQKASGLKMGIGLIDSRKVLLVAGYNVTMQQFAYVFKALGAKGALNLDTGGSAAFFYNGSYKLGPGRDIPNAIIFAR